MRGNADNGIGLASWGVIALILVLVLLALTDVDPRLAGLLRLGR
jgi:hypothetical protein